jgi:hypothetical protein
MAAGLLTNASNYNDAAGTDDLVPCSGPSLGTNGNCLFGPGPCYGASTCSLFSQLNFVNTFEQFTSISGYQRSDSAGSTDQLFGWLCNAPKVALNFGSHPIETMSGAQELDLGLTPSHGPPVTSCPAGIDQVPAVQGDSTFTTVNDPSQQALKAYNSVFGSGSTNPYASFADMNWAEASYFGMNIAALQNAAGNFVQPTQASLDAAVADAKTNPDGTLTPQNLASDGGAYPMPSVIYAAVSTAPMPQNQATAISQLLTQMLQVTSGTEGSQNPSAQLPLGFVPLPANLVTSAQNDVKNDIHVLAATATPTPSSGTSGSSPASETTNSTNSGLTQGASGDLTSIGGDNIIGAADILSPFVQALLGGTTAVATAGAGPQHSNLPLLGPVLPGFALVAGHGKALLQAATILGISALALGMVLMAGGFVSRRRFLRVAPAAADGLPVGSSP